VALVQFGRNCKCSFEGYRIVALDRQRKLLLLLLLLSLVWLLLFLDYITVYMSAHILIAYFLLPIANYSPCINC